MLTAEATVIGLTNDYRGSEAKCWTKSATTTTKNAERNCLAWIDWDGSRKMWRNSLLRIEQIGERAFWERRREQEQNKEKNIAREIFTSEISFRALEGRPDMYGRRFDKLSSHATRSIISIHYNYTHTYTHRHTRTHNRWIIHWAAIRTFQQFTWSNSYYTHNLHLTQPRYDDCVVVIHAAVLDLFFITIWMNNRWNRREVEAGRRYPLDMVQRTGLSGWNK